VQPGEELPQVILDSKAQHSVSWKASVLLYDNTFDRDMISRCIIAISRNFPDESVNVKPLSVSIYKIKVNIDDELLEQTNSFSISNRNRLTIGIAESLFEICSNPCPPSSLAKISWFWSHRS
jgi:hypothetical protein